MKPTAPTIRDVAAAAGVSVSTVSNVLNCRDASTSPATRRHVLEVIEQLGYRPQASARGLRTARRRAVAMIVVDESEAYLQDPFPAAIVAGLTAHLNELGYVAVLHGCRYDQFERTAAIRQHGVDGYCLLLSGDEAARRRIVETVARYRQPLVLFEETAAPAGDIVIVRQDDADGGRQLANHLLARGARDVAFVGPQLCWPAVEARFAGFREAANAAGQPMRIRDVRTPSEAFEDVYAAVTAALLVTPLEALVCANDQIALAALQAAQDAGRSIPDDLLVTGFNGLGSWRHCRPHLTTVRSPARELGRTGAAVLIDRLERGAFPDAPMVLPVALQPGGTT